MPPRRKKSRSLSPSLLIFCLSFTIVFRILTYFPSNDDLLSSSSSSVVRHFDQSPPEVLLGAGRKDRLVFVHVGKAAGETIVWRIKLSCTLRKNKFLKEECARQFQGEESSLSKATVGILHCDKLRPRFSIKNATTFLYSLRNPIDRIVSWYQYMHPENCFADRPSAACNLKQATNPWGVNFYSTCFPDVNDFARSIGKDSILKHGMNCTAFALQTVRGEGPAGMSSGRAANIEQSVSSSPNFRFRYRC
jgi:Sulfotransferase family